MFEDRIALTVKEAAAATGYNYQSLYKAIREGKLKGYRPGGKGDYRVFAEDIREWLRGNSQESAA